MSHLIVVLFLKQLKCSIMSPISVFERVKSALNSNDEVIMRTIYDDLSCRLRSRREVSTEEHSRAIRSSSSFLAQTINLFKCMKRKELGLVLL